MVTDERRLTQAKADTINDEMARRMERRRDARPERRKRSLASTPVATERRRICEYCYQAGDHSTPAQCLSALER